jgi:hypothetical protein
MATKRKIRQYLDALRQRQVNFRELTAVLRSHDMPTATGWDRLIPKFESLAADVDLSAYENVLRALYRNHVLYSDRAVVVFQFPEGELAPLLKNIDSWVDSSNSFSEAFPFPVRENALRALSSDPVYTKLTIRTREVGGDGLIACSKRYVRSREVIQYADFPTEVLKALAGYDEIVGIKSKFIQAFDTVIFRSQDDQIALTIDLCGDLSLQDASRAILIHIEMLDERLSSAGFKGGISNLRLNFFPKIAALYSTDDGVVERIGHVTTSGSNKSERMRAKDSDLRLEPYHKEGLKAILGGTDLFSIGKRWDGGGYSIGLEIPGTHKQAGDPNAVIQVAIFDGCRNGLDFKKVLNYLVQ